jgi:hypothetical protein
VHDHNEYDERLEMLIRVVRLERIQQIYFLCAVQIVQIPTKHRYNLVPRVCPLAETLAAAGHVLRPKFSVRGCVVKVSNYINRLPVGYYV